MGTIWAHGFGVGTAVETTPAKARAHLSKCGHPRCSTSAVPPWIATIATHVWHIHHDLFPARTIQNGASGGICGGANNPYLRDGPVAVAKSEMGEDYDSRETRDLRQREAAELIGPF